MTIAADSLPVKDEDLKDEPEATPTAKQLDQLERHRPGDPNELLKHRFLCRGGALLLCGPTGIGKSSFIMQCCIMWSLGKPLFGFEPTRSLRTLIVQSENDDGDMSEMVDGVFRGIGLSEEDQAAASKAILVHHCNLFTGFDACQKVFRPLLEKHKPDLLIIDPVFAFLGGDASSQRDVTTFLRNMLQPLLTEFNCCLVTVHHTNKPAIGREKPNWQHGDFAYSGSGSAEFANFSRAVVTIRSVGRPDVFELIVGKRGSRLGWKEADGKTKAYSKPIGHSLNPGEICWREVDPSEMPQEPTGKTDPTPEALLAHVPTADGETISKAELTTKAMETMSRDQVRAMLKKCLDDGSLHEWKIPKKGCKPATHIARHPQPDCSLLD